MKSANFRFQKTSEGLTRPIPDGRQLVSIAVYDFRPEFHSEITLCTRLDAVEDVLHEVLDTPQKYRSASYTVQTPLASVVGEASAKWRVSTPEHVSTAMDEGGPSLCTDVLDFFDRNCTVSALHHAINVERWPHFDNQNDPIKSMRALIVACQAGSKDLDRINAECQSRMAQLIESEREKFERLVEFLGRN